MAGLQFGAPIIRRPRRPKPSLAPPSETVSPDRPPLPTPQVALPPAPLPVAPPTFEPPAPRAPDPRIASLTQELSQPLAPLSTAGTDPRLQQLLDEMAQQVTRTQTAGAAARERLKGLDQPLAIKPFDAGRFETQAAPLRALISELIQGRGPAIGPIGSDPEAQAYRAAKLRAGERQRESEANRLAASGATGSGDFDARIAGIEEATGEDIAGFEAGLTGRRRREATETALQGANVSLADLARGEAGERGRFESELELERARRGGLITQAELEAGDAGRTQASLQSLFTALLAQEAEGFRGRELEQRGRESNRAVQQRLLDTLLAEQGRTEEAGLRRTGFSSDEAMRALQRELTAQAVEEGQRKLGRGRGFPRGTRFGSFGGAILPGQ